MKIIKKINNNVALAQDARGRELIVFGKGVGFPVMPYELTDLSSVQRTFYDVDEKYFDLLRDVPQEVFLASDDIAENAREELDCPLNPNLTYVLADHLHFAIQRCREGFTLHTPLAYDIRHLYPQEYECAHLALAMLNQRLSVQLPESEAICIAMHIITAEGESDDMHATMLTAKVISEISDLVESSLRIHLDKEGFGYSRFAMHMRYLVQRMMEGKSLGGDEGVAAMLHTMRREYPDVYACVLAINDFLQKNYHWTCTREEQLYLLMHIRRVQSECSDTPDGRD